MKALDRLLQRWRINVGLGYLGDAVRVIDIGAHHGELFDTLGQRLHLGFGIESLANCERQGENYTIRRGIFPQMRPETKEWDAITMFAVLEHIPRSEHRAVADACYDLLRPGGRVVITVPSKKVDYILPVLRALNLIEGMSLEQHFGLEISEVPSIFNQPRFTMREHRRFQFGLNHLFVFEKS